MTAPPAQRRRQRQRSAARRAILDATEALLVEDGYERFSMRRLAERCGYTAPTIYHYFGDKPGLMDELIEERFERLLVRLRRVPPRQDPVEYLRELVRTFVDFGLSHPTHYRLLMTPRRNGAEPPRSAEEARAMMDAPLRELVRQGRLRGSQRDMVYRTFWALTHGMISLCNDVSDYPFSKDLLEFSLDAFLNGLLLPDPAPQRKTTA